MDSSSTTNPAYPTTAHIDNSGKPPDYTYSQGSAAELESQHTQWSAPPPAYWPGPQPPRVPIRMTVQQQTESRRQRRRGLRCCIVLAFLLVAIFIVVTVIQVVARVDYSNNLNN